jgi:hypothetical protein
MERRPNERKPPGFAVARPLPLSMDVWKLPEGAQSFSSLKMTRTR